MPRSNVDHFIAEARGWIDRDITGIKQAAGYGICPITLRHVFHIRSGGAVIRHGRISKSSASPESIRDVIICQKHQSMSNPMGAVARGVGGKHLRLTRAEIIDHRTKDCEVCVFSTSQGTSKCFHEDAMHTTGMATSIANAETSTNVMDSGEDRLAEVVRFRVALWR